MPTQDMIIGLYHLTHREAGWHGRGPGRSARTPRRGWRSTTASCTCRRRCRIRLHGVTGVDNGAGGRAVGRAGGLAAEATPLIVETTLGRVLFNETLPPGYRFVNYEIRKGQLSAIVNDLAERFPKVAAGGDPGRAQGGRLPLGHLVRRDHRHGGRHRAAAQAGDPRAVREGGRADRQAVPAWSDDRRGASRRAHRDLDQGDQRGGQGDGDRAAAGEPAVDDDPLGRPR